MYGISSFGLSQDLSITRKEAAAYIQKYFETYPSIKGFLLQVHDELLIETWKDEIPQVSKILEEEMKGAAKLAVELEVDMHQGNNWYEAK